MLVCRRCCPHQYPLSPVSAEYPLATDSVGVHVHEHQPVSDLAIYLERCPVVLSEDEQKLYGMGFHSTRPREFVSLVLAGEWKDAARGDQVATEGEAISSVYIAVSG